MNGYGDPARSRPANLQGESQRRQLPREARDGIMRVWLEILRERRPGVTWVPAVREPDDQQRDLDEFEVEGATDDQLAGAA